MSNEPKSANEQLADELIAQWANDGSVDPDDGLDPGPTNAELRKRQLRRRLVVLIVIGLPVVFGFVVFRSDFAYFLKRGKAPTALGQVLKWHADKGAYDRLGHNTYVSFSDCLPANVSSAKASTSRGCGAFGSGPKKKIYFFQCRLTRALVRTESDFELVSAQTIRLSPYAASLIRDGKLDISAFHKYRLFKGKGRLMRLSEVGGWGRRIRDFYHKSMGASVDNAWIIMDGGKPQDHATKFYVFIAISAIFLAYLALVVVGYVRSREA